MWHRQRVSLRIAQPGERVDPRSLRIGQSDPLADLVEGLADGVVAGLGEGVYRAVLDLELIGMTARDDQRDEPPGHLVGRAALRVEER